MWHCGRARQRRRRDRPRARGAPGGIQTPDPRFRRPMLYSLSYGRVQGFYNERRTKDRRATLGAFSPLALAGHVEASANDDVHTCGRSTTPWKQRCKVKWLSARGVAEYRPHLAALMFSGHSAAPDQPALTRYRGLPCSIASFAASLPHSCWRCFPWRPLPGFRSAFRLTSRRLLCRCTYSRHHQPKTTSGRRAIGLTVMTVTTGCRARGCWLPSPVSYGHLATGVGEVVYTFGTAGTGVLTSASMVA